MLLLLVLVSSLSPKSFSHPTFPQFKHKYHISYQSHLQSYRLNVYNENINRIKRHNSKPIKTYQMNVNKFMDLTDQEWMEVYLGFKGGKIAVKAREITGNLAVNTNKKVQKLKQDNSTANINWVLKGAVTKVKDQGNCGSCWAFSSTGALQALNYVVNGVLKSFSEQQLVDCTTSYGNIGCNGGLMTNSYNYLMSNPIVQSSIYPYTGVASPCMSTSGTFSISSYTILSSCSSILSSLLFRPISVGIDATNWKGYSSGVFNDCVKIHDINHAVLIVGLKDGNWWIKNSWGTGWGEQGYISLGKGNMCGICELASYPSK